MTGECQGNGRTSRGTIDLGKAVLMRKRETEWKLKLRTVYPVGLDYRTIFVKMIKV